MRRGNRSAKTTSDLAILIEDLSSGRVQADDRGTACLCHQPAYLQALHACKYAPDDGAAAAVSRVRFVSLHAADNTT
jgi:hypothetical protein